jgi:hypothetical protein
VLSLLPKNAMAVVLSRHSTITIWDQTMLQASAAEQFSMRQYIQERCTMGTLKNRQILLNKKQHGILKGLMEYGYKDIDKGTKVCHLMDGLKTDKLDAVKASINANAMLQKDFDLAVVLYTSFIK